MQARAERTRNVILEAAAETFEARGYQGTSLQDIVAGRDVSKGALYFHFQTKEDLAITILREQLDLWHALVDELRVRGEPVILLIPKLFWRVHAILRDNVMARASARLACEGDLIGTSVPRLFCGQADLIDGLLQEARDQGDLRPDVDTRVIAELIVATFAGLQRMMSLKAVATDLHDHLTTMWAHLLPRVVEDERVTEVMAHIDAMAPPQTP